MKLANDDELKHTQEKLALLQERIQAVSSRPQTDANLASLRSLVQMANQLREEIVRYAAQQQRHAS